MLSNIVLEIIMSKKMRDMPHDKKDNETDYFISNSEDIPILLQNMGAIKILFWVIFFMTGTIMRAFGPKYVWLFALIIIVAFIVYIYISFNTLKNIYKDRKKFLEAFYINNLTFIISLVILFISEGIVYINTSEYNFIVWMVAALFLVPTFDTRKKISEKYGK